MKTVLGFLAAIPVLLATASGDVDLAHFGIEALIAVASIGSVWGIMRQTVKQLEKEVGELKVLVAALSTVANTAHEKQLALLDERVKRAEEEIKASRKNRHRLGNIVTKLATAMIEKGISIPQSVYEEEDEA